MLINLVSIHPAPSPQSIPLANAFLKSYALKSSVSIRLVDFFLADDPVACSEILADLPIPDAVGFSVYVWNREMVCVIVSELRRCYPKVRLFCGGPEVTADPVSILTLNMFDFIVVGEGESPFLTLCETLEAGTDISVIPGILLPDSDILPPPTPISDLDTIPSPYLTGVIDTQKTPGILWQLSRGCSFTCDFCFDSRGIHGVRHFSLQRVESELKHFSSSGVSQVFVLDSTFNFDKKRAKNILRMIKKYAPDIHFHFEVRSEFIDYEMAQLFSQIACSLQIGLQSADCAVLKLVGRTFDKADFSTKIGLLNESGATFGFDLIYGLPGDTFDGFCRSLDFSLSLYPNHLDIFPLAVLPGTKLATHGTELQMRWNRHPPYLVETTDSFSAEDISKATDLAVACDVFYTRGKAVAWFNSVTTALGLKPSEFLQQFSCWITERLGYKSKESDFSDDNITELQKLFLEKMFGGKKARRFLPLVIDIVQYHNLYAALLLAPLPETKNQTCNWNDISIQLAPSARIVRFIYDIDELLECGEPNFLWMYEHLSPSGSYAVMYNFNGMVCTESLVDSYISILKQIRDSKFCSIKSETGLTSNEIDEFLEFALQEGFLVKVD